MVDGLTPKRDINLIFDFLESHTHIGLDTEFTQNRGATYIQISTLQYGFIFNTAQKNSDVREQMEWENINPNKVPHPLRYNPVFLDRLRALLCNPHIYKIGYSLGNDIKAIKRLFNGDFEEEKVGGMLGLEKYLFTFPSNMGLSTLVKRHYGLPLNKDF